MQKRSTHNGVIGQRYVNNHEDLLERDTLRGAPIMTGISKMLLTGTPKPSILMRGVSTKVSLDQGYPYLCHYFTREDVNCTPIIYQHLMYKGAPSDEVDFK
jgi:hypothetical protein